MEGVRKEGDEEGGDGEGRKEEEQINVQWRKKSEQRRDVL